MLNLGETLAWEFKAQTPLVVTMNSIDIAGLVGSRPSDVKRSIERLAATGVISKPPMVDGEKSANGIVTKVCVFEGEQGKRDSVDNDRKAKAEAEGLPFPCKKYRKLRHDNFMNKVPKVLGENQSPKFLGDYLDYKGRTQPCYNFPKREAFLMLISDISPRQIPIPPEILYPEEARIVLSVECYLDD